MRHASHLTSCCSRPRFMSRRDGVCRRRQLGSRACREQRGRTACPHLRRDLWRARARCREDRSVFGRNDVRELLLPSQEGTDAQRLGPLHRCRRYRVAARCQLPHARAQRRRAPRRAVRSRAPFRREPAFHREGDGKYYLAFRGKPGVPATFTVRVDNEAAAPASPPATGSARRLASGDSHTCFVRDDRTVICWGLNDKRQLGDTTTINRSSPLLPVRDLSGVFAGVVEIAAARNSTCALRADGTVACWGANEQGGIGIRRGIGLPSRLGG